MILKLGFSPCPNDCFIFDALINKKIDLEGLNFEPIMEDVEALNKRALNADLEVSKLSFHAFSYLTNSYTLLKSGSALGFNCGPILISKRPITVSDLQSSETKIAIPGKLTTANLLLSIAYPNLTNKTEVLFSDVETLVLNEEFDAGLIIHENRFTFESKGLIKIKDLGEFWESLIKSPIPLGGIFVRNELQLEIKVKINRIIKRSLEYAFANPNSSKSFVKEHAQEMSDEVIQKHIKLYVNDFSIDLGQLGITAVETLLKKSKELGLIKDFPKLFYVP